MNVRNIVAVFLIVSCCASTKYMSVMPGAEISLNQVNAASELPTDEDIKRTIEEFLKKDLWRSGVMNRFTNCLSDVGFNPWHQQFLTNLDHSTYQNFCDLLEKSAGIESTYKKVLTELWRPEVFEKAQLYVEHEDFEKKLLYSVTWGVVMLKLAELGDIDIYKKLVGGNKLLCHVELDEESLKLLLKKHLWLRTYTKIN